MPRSSGSKRDIRMHLCDRSLHHNGILLAPRHCAGGSSPPHHERQLAEVGDPRCAPSRFSVQGAATPAASGATLPRTLEKRCGEARFPPVQIFINGTEQGTSAPALLSCRGGRDRCPVAEGLCCRVELGSSRAEKHVARSDYRAGRSPRDALPRAGRLSDDHGFVHAE